MTAGRVLASLTAAAAVGGCVVAVLAMSGAGEGSASTAAGSTPHYVITQRKVPVSVSPAVSFAASHEAARHAALVTEAQRAATAGAVSTARTAGTSQAQPPATFTPPAPPSPRPSATRAATSVAAHTEASSTPARSTSPRRGIALPLKYHTGTATRVLTVTAVSRGRTTARLQAWNKAPGGGWLKYGTSMTAHIGSQGMTPTPSESASKTPMGSFTLTRAFGHDADPGTALPYFRTRPSDWWISQPGPLYNSHQRCSSHCSFTQGAPNEHLYYETPYYNYAVVIDYNTRNAPGGVRQGAGSAFFLHVTDGYATAGCVAIPQQRLIRLMRWLRPATHPRILIGVHR